jgi:hypothetical protein
MARGSETNKAQLIDNAARMERDPGDGLGCGILAIGRIVLHYVAFGCVRGGGLRPVELASVLSLF